MADQGVAAADARETDGPDALLTTKLSAPETRAPILPRPRLLDRLDDGTRSALTLVCAPAGYGKTTLLIEWSRRSDRPFAWVSLDAQDDDAGRFWGYVFAALELLRPGVGAEALALLRSPQPPPIESILTVAINGLAALPRAGVLVLDDYHLIEDRAIHAALAFLLAHLPPRLRLVIAGRADPPLPLARLRARGQLTELRAADLRCTPEETAAFLRDVMGLALAAGDVAALEERTEGWIAALQLAALSLRGQADGAAFVAAFAGSHRHVVDYLVDEVLARQPGDVHTFLLHTAILDRLGGALYDAVTGRGDGQALLEGLERANLFIVPLDDERRWYRYHHLFADVLRQRLRRADPAGVPRLHRRAAAWYERECWVTEAIGHALAAGDTAWAVRLAEEHVETAVLRSEVAAVRHWLALLPGDVVRSRPRLCVAAAVVALVGHDLEAVEPWLRDAERGLGTGDRDEAPPDPSAPAEDGPSQGAGTLADELFADLPLAIVVICGTLARLRGDAARAIACAQRALDHLPDTGYLRGVAAWDLGLAYWMGGDLAAADRVLGALSARATPTGSVETLYAPLLGLYYQGQVQIAQGRLHAAAATYRRAQRLGAPEGRPRLPAAGWAEVGLGELLREWDDLDGAARHLRAGLDLGARVGDAAPLAQGYVALARVRQARGDAAGALDAIEMARRLAPGADVIHLFNPVEAQRARLWLLQGDVAAAARWVEERGLRQDDALSYAREAAHAVLARVLLAQGAPRDARALLDRLGEQAEAGGRVGSAIEILALRALAEEACGDMATALATLGRALALAEPEGYVRLFVDEGMAMMALLRRAAAEGLSPAYAHRLLAAAAPPGAPAPPAVARPTAASPLPESLTPREREVLELLAAGAQNGEIAARLYVTLDTVKKHVGHIFGKLGVGNRTQAVARARALGLIP